MLIWLSTKLMFANPDYGVTLEVVMATLSDFMKSTSREVDVIKNDRDFQKPDQGAQEPTSSGTRTISNAGAREVGATRIDIAYTRAREGHVFEVGDNGCGMEFTGNQDFPGRLDRFLGLGLSAIAGQSADEFSWKGSGSKLSYQSRRVQIEDRGRQTTPYTT